MPGGGSFTALTFYPTPVPLVGVGTDHKLRTRSSLSRPWTVMQSPASLNSIAVRLDGSFVGYGSTRVLSERSLAASPAGSRHDHPHPAGADKPRHIRAAYQDRYGLLMC